MDRDPTGIVRWRVRTADPDQLVAAGSRFWHDNRRRPGAAVIVQYTRQGALTVRLRGRRLRVPPGHAVLLRFGDACDYGLDPGEGGDYRCAYATCQGAGLQAHWRELTALYGPVAAWGAPLLAEILAVAASAHAEAGQQAAAVQALVQRLYRGPAGTAISACERAIAAIRADPCAVASLKRLAAEHGLSREHLTRAFSAAAGEPAWAYITRMRLARARSLLADRSLPVAAVARLCGYASARVLARNLVAATGHPPEAWRR